MTGHSGEDVFPFGENGPWKEFENSILNRGHTICRGGFSETPDAIIANSYSSQIERHMRISGIPMNKRVLINWEPFIVERERYTKKVLSKFGNHYAPSIYWAERTGGKAFNWPQDEIKDLGVFENWESRTSRAVMIQGNKFSARQGELYSLRRKVLKEMKLDELSLFGTNWNAGLKFDWWHWSSSLLNSRIHEISLKSIQGIGAKYSSYKGVTENKFETLGAHAISIVIENSGDFVSEKLFDSVRAGCVSVYVGPNLREFGIPRESAICVEGNPKKLAKKIRELQGMSKSDLKTIAVDQFSNLSKVSEKWINFRVLSNLANDILDTLDS